MKLRFLGTGAAGCINTPENEIKEGQRRCSSMLIDDNILVDVPLQAFDYAEKLGIDTSKITDVLLTHSHGDHFQKSVLLKFADNSNEKINFWCHKKAVENLNLSESDKEKIFLHTLDDMEKSDISNAHITVLPANHMTKGDEQPLHYIVEKNGKSIMYGCDGGWFMARTWEYMRTIKLDAIVLDTTVGEDAGNFRIGTHNSFPMLRIINEALLQNGIMDENGVRIGSHIAPSVHQLDHKGTADALSEIGMLTAYDGFETEI